MRRIGPWLASMAFLVATCMAAQSTVAGTEGKTGSVDLWVKAAITINPDGKITALQWDGKPKPALAAVQSAIEPKVMVLEFVPGTVDGVAMETETTLSLKLALRERPDKSWDIRITKASTGAAALDMTPPNYPSSQARSGTEAEVISEIEVHGDGRVTVLDSTYRGSRGENSGRKEFLNASAAAIKGWRYRVERVGGHPVAARVSIPIRFCLGGTKSPWCDGSEGETRSADGREGPAGEAIALESVASLKTDLATLDI